jgi:hypothetical protein
MEGAPKQTMEGGLVEDDSQYIAQHADNADHSVGVFVFFGFCD